MKLRFTPLNFASAALLFFAVYIAINGAKVTGVPFVHLTATLSWIFAFFALAVIFLDILFRNFFAEAKKLWIVELSFITLVAVIFLLVK